MLTRRRREREIQEWRIEAGATREALRRLLPSLLRFNEVRVLEIMEERPDCWERATLLMLGALGKVES